LCSVALVNFEPAVDIADTYFEEKHTLQGMHFVLARFAALLQAHCVPDNIERQNFVLAVELSEPEQAESVLPVAVLLVVVQNGSSMLTAKSVVAVECYYFDLLLA
jgi:hypothetical protein